MSSKLLEVKRTLANKKKKIKKIWLILDIRIIPMNVYSCCPSVSSEEYQIIKAPKQSCQLLKVCLIKHSLIPQFRRQIT